MDIFEYCYGPLNLYKNEIRLVVLRPSQEHNTIECNIINTTLNNTDENQNELNEFEYEALSYTWGSPDVMKAISIDGQTCSVRENLWLALYHLRLKNTSRVLWIDALCIDQNDARERNHQVAQMDKVFKHAKRVLVWLGLAGTLDKVALWFIGKTEFQLSLRSENGSHLQFHESAKAPTWKAVVNLY
jgi:hypothetical protein